jgi:predicted ATPase
VTLISHGLLLTELGQAQEALTLIMRAITELRSIGDPLNLPHHLWVLAKAYAMLGQPLEGLNCLTEAVQFIEQTEGRVGEADMHRLRGDLSNAIGDLANAERSYQQAIAVATRQSAKLFELRASTSLVRLWRDQGKRTEARDLLAPVYGWFTEGFDTLDLKEAKALLDELSS